MTKPALSPTTGRQIRSGVPNDKYRDSPYWDSVKDEKKPADEGEGADKEQPPSS